MVNESKLKACASERLLTRGPCATAPLARELDTSRPRMHRILSELEAEGCVSRSDSDPPVWTLVRPHDSGTFRDTVMLVLWDRAEPMSTAEMREAMRLMGREFSTDNYVLRCMQKEGLLSAGYRGFDLVFWVRGRCSPDLPRSDEPRFKDVGLYARIFSYLDGIGYPVDTETVAADLGVDARSAKDALYKMFKAGKLDRVKSAVRANCYLYFIPGEAAA